MSDQQPTAESIDALLFEHLARGKFGGNGFCVGIPHLWRSNLLRWVLDGALSGTAIPERVFIVANWKRFEHPDHRINVIRPLCNLGVAATWNMLHALCPDRPLIILNDDVRPGRNTFERMLANPAGCVSAPGCRYGAFLLRRETLLQIGPFDEEFYPYGCDDADYDWRLRVAGCPRVDADGDPCEHWGGSGGTVLQGGDRLRAVFQASWDRAHEYYVRKWGGHFGGGERFTRPFGGVK